MSPDTKNLGINKAKSKHTRTPLYRSLSKIFSHNISQRIWTPDEAIPTESELAKEHRVSIGTVRKAIDSLVKDGLLERLQGKGTYVLRAQFHSSLFRFFRFHREEGSYQVPSSRILKRELSDLPPAVASEMGLPAGLPAIHLTRLRLINKHPILLETIWLPKHKFSQLLDLNPEEYGDLLYPLYEKYCGIVIASAQETLTAENASEAHAHSLGIKSGASLIVIDRLAMAYDREPLEWRRSRGPADQFRYHVEIR
jgi:GntR family transcriptional regulator